MTSKVTGFSNIRTFVELFNFRSNEIIDSISYGDFISNDNLFNYKYLFYR